MSKRQVLKPGLRNSTCVALCARRTSSLSSKVLTIDVATLLLWKKTVKKLSSNSVWCASQDSKAS